MKWEYRQWQTGWGGRFDDDDLNALGAEGWELVSTYEDVDGLTLAILKRPLPTTEGGGE